MDVIKELEAMRGRMIDTVNAEFDLLIRRISDEGIAVSGAGEEESRDSSHYLSAGTKVFKGTKPICVIFADGNKVYVPNWKQAVRAIMEECLENENYAKRLLNLRGMLSGKKRILINESGAEMKSPLQLKKNLYIETHYDTETLLNIMTRRILDEIGFDYSRIKITVRKKSQW